MTDTELDAIAKEMTRRFLKQDFEDEYQMLQFLRSKLGFVRDRSCEKGHNEALQIAAEVARTRGIGGELIARDILAGRETSA